MRMIRWVLAVCACALLWAGCCSKTAETLDSTAVDLKVGQDTVVPPVEYLVWEYLPTDAGTDYLTAWVVDMEGIPQVLERRSGVWIAVDNDEGRSSLWQASVELTGEVRTLDDDCVQVLEELHVRLDETLYDESLLPCLTVRTKVPQLHFRNRDTGKSVVIPAAYEARDPKYEPSLFREYFESVSIVGTAGSTIFATRCAVQEVWGAAHGSGDCEAILFDADTGTRKDVGEWAGEWLSSSELHALREEAFEAMHAQEDHPCAYEFPEAADDMSLAMLWPDLLGDTMHMNYRFLTDGSYVCSAYGWGSYTLAFDTRSAVLPPNVPKDHVQTPPLIQEYTQRFGDHIARGWSAIRFGTNVPRQFVYR